METPDTIHGRMKEGAHLAGYSLQRTLENLRWLLEDGRYKELSPGYSNVNEFLRDTAGAFSLLNINPAERKEIAKLIKEAEQEASQRAIADMLGVSEITIARDFGKRDAATNVADEPQKQVYSETESATNVAPTIPPDDFNPVEHERKERERVNHGDEPETAINNPVLYSSESDEWYTPNHIVYRVLLVMGEIDLDPCSNDKNNPVVPAGKVFTKEDNGLVQEWDGRVYMNPPYGREIADWVEYLVEQYEYGQVSEAIALVPSRTDTEWFKDFREYPRCFVWGRLKFSDNGNAAPFPSMAVYLGENVQGFIDAFSDIGDIYLRVENV